MSKLSNDFFGNKKFMIKQYEQLKQTQGITDNQIKSIFQPYTSVLSNIKSLNGQCTLLALFAQFIRGNLMMFYNWEFQKLSAFVQLSAHVFQHTFESHLSKQRSFQYFSEIAVKHSLFRPPHSINIFTYQQVKELTTYWIDTFIRYYSQYLQCFQSDHNQIIYTICGGFQPQEFPTSTKKQFTRQNFNTLFGSKITVIIPPPIVPPPIVAPTVPQVVPSTIPSKKKIA